MANGFVKATRDDVFAKVLFYGNPGTGKTYTALRMATGFASQCGSRVALIDTENGRASYYADDFDFDRLILEAPYTSKKYMEAIDMAIDAGYKVLIIDSLTHEWVWCNETVNNMPGMGGANKWLKVKTQFHNPFVEKVIQSKIHIFATARGSTKFDKTDDGKLDYKKFTDGIAQDKDTEFNYTASFMLDQQSHVATCSKDNTHLFENRFEVLTEKDGILLYKWCKSDNAVKASVKTTETMSNMDEVEAAQAYARAQKEANTNLNVEEVVGKITSTFKSIMDSGVDKEILYNIVAENNGGKKNWMGIKDLTTAQNILTALENYSK